MELKWSRCPFCGNEEIVFDEGVERAYAQARLEDGEGYVVSISCSQCGATMKAYGNMNDEGLNDGETLDDVIHSLNFKWNRREELEEDVWKIRDALQGRIDTLVAENESLTRTIDSLRDSITDERAVIARCSRELNELKDAIIRWFMMEVEK